MIVFISKKNYQKVLEGVNDIKWITSIDPLIDFLKYSIECGYDSETNGLDPFTANHLLYQFGNSEIQYVLDATSYDLNLLRDYLSNVTLIGHNLKFDYKMAKMKQVTIRNLYDTMVAEEIIAKGSGLRFNLNEVAQRRLGILPLAKDVRETFWGHSPERLFSPNQIRYAAEDVEHMIPLKEAQMKFVDMYGYHRDLFQIEFPLIPIIGDAELEGFLLDEDKWRGIIVDNERIADEQVAKMIEILIQLKAKYPRLGNLRLKPNAKIQKSEQLDMFGESQVVASQPKSTVNFNSPTQVRQIFIATYSSIPTTKKKDETLGKKMEKESFGEDALVQWQINHPDSDLYNFVDELIKYKKALKAVSSFGDRFLYSILRRKGKPAQRGYKNEVTGRVHTIYRQCGTETTRMASGNASEGYYNSQNIPKDKRYREAFIADTGYSIITCDLGSAELVIAASLSGDKRLFELVNSEDIHSPIATYCYNAVISYIVENMKLERAKREVAELLEADHKLLNISEAEAKEITKERVDRCFKDGYFEITDDTAHDIRTKFKNVNYGLIYGASAERIMEVLGCAKAYATVIEQALKEYLPDLFKYLDENAASGVENGYIRFNQRNGGRRWFKVALDAFAEGKQVPFRERGEIERMCKNSPIQGTQGHMIKEAMVRYFYEYVYPNDYDVRLKLQVHDELVVMFKTGEEEHALKLVEYMINVSNEYLAEGFEMKASYKILPYWTK